MTINLDKILKYKGITAYRLSKDLKISTALIYEIKKGQRKGMRVETLQKISNYLGMSIDEMISISQQ